MENNIILTSIPLQQLEEMLETAVRRVVGTPTVEKSVDEEELLTRQQAAEYLNISLPTLHKITQEGLPFHRVGNKVRYKKGDLREFTRQKYS